MLRALCFLASFLPWARSLRFNILALNSLEKLLMDRERNEQREWRGTARGYQHMLREIVLVPETKAFSPAGTLGSWAWIGPPVVRVRVVAPQFLYLKNEDSDCVHLGGCCQEGVR